MNITSTGEDGTTTSTTIVMEKDNKTDEEEEKKKEDEEMLQKYTSTQLDSLHFTLSTKFMFSSIIHLLDAYRVALTRPLSILSPTITSSKLLSPTSSTASVQHFTTLSSFLSAFQFSILNRDSTNTSFNIDGNVKLSIRSNMERE